MKSFYFLIAALSVFAVSCGKDDKGTGGSGPAIVTEDRTIRNLDALIDHRDKMSLVGRPVELDNVVVRETRGDVVFLAGPSGTRWIPMVDGAELKGLPNPQIKVGQVLRLKGKVGSLSNPENPQKFWNMITEAERARIMPSQIYVSADEITILRNVGEVVFGDVIVP